MALWLYTSHSAVHTQTQTQTESEAFKTHVGIESIYFIITNAMEFAFAIHKCERALLTTPVTPGEYSRSVGALTHDVLLVVTVKISRVNSAVLFLKQNHG